MISSMFSLDHRLAELRPTADELRVARQLRAAAAPERPPAITTRRWSNHGASPTRVSRVTAS